jgi:hypothetical protein
VNRRIIGIATAETTGLTDKNMTTEQIALQTLKEQLKRKPTAKELHDYLENDKQRVARENQAIKDRPIQEQAEEVAAAIMRGEQAPTLSGFGMAKLAGPVKAILAKNGYNQKQAELDYHATQKYLTTLNGAQQTRLRQATNFAYDSLNIIDDLAKKWDAGNFPPLNRARMLAAKNGAYGPVAQDIAIQLSTQIADMTSELGTVYKGGNSSTDESLKLAAQNLQGDWPTHSLLNNTKLIRRNLDIRKNSMTSTGAAGLSTGDPGFVKPTGSTVEPRKSGESIADYLERTKK